MLDTWPNDLASSLPAAARGNNLTKMGNNSNPRDVAMLIAAQARAPVDCPTLQAIGPQATNQAVKAIAIARTFLKESQSIDSEHHCIEHDRLSLPLLPTQRMRAPRGHLSSNQALSCLCTVCVQPEFFQLEDGHSGLLLPIRKKSRRARSGEDEAQSLKAASGTDAKVLAGAVSSFAREGRRMLVTAIGAAAINQAVKAIAIARKNIEEVRGHSS
jgi:stage V sporulation protein SpoVS